MCLFSDVNFEWYQSGTGDQSGTLLESSLCVGDTWWWEYGWEGEKWQSATYVTEVTPISRNFWNLVKNIQVQNLDIFDQVCFSRIPALARSKFRTW